MDQNYPIYTAQVECQDCYKCVRECPVKAIKVNDGHASIIPDLCTSCGHCVVVCPVKAKKIRDDFSRVELLLSQNAKTYVSLAPSWITEFKGIEKSQMIAAIKKLGFTDVSETALGAQEVTAGYLRLLHNSGPGLYISSACPSVVELISKHMSPHKENICNILSPLLAHTNLLRSKYGNDIKIVFFGPCIAKKIEADRYPEKLNLALTFQDLKRLFEEHEIYPDALPLSQDNFIPYTAEEGSLYPIDGGMLQSMGRDIDDIETLTISGLEHLQYYLKEFNGCDTDRKIFIEALACRGGCINGPCRSVKSSGLKDRFTIKETYKESHDSILRQSSVQVLEKLRFPKIKSYPKQSDEKIKKALAKIGKVNPDDELNCGGCGYDTCRLFAEALLKGNAEPAMCVSLMRKKALNKANAILRCMPSAAVIVDSSMKIIECNKHFAEMFGEDTLQLYEILPSLKGAYLEKIVPFANLFRTAMRTGEDLFRENLRAGDKLLHLTLFTIEPGQVIGGIIQDATEIEMKREEIASKANVILRKNLNTVQGVAKLLGEHMADTEILLRSIAKGFNTPETTTQVVAVKREHQDE